MTQIKPLQVKNHLAGTPKNKPHFSKKIKIKNGEELECSDPQILRGLIALMDMNAVLGGAACHYGGPAALSEIWSATHALMFSEAQKKNKPWHELFHFVNDAGHCENGLYAIKANYEMAGLNFNSLKQFRSIESKLTGHGESHLFPEGVYVSNGPLGSAFPQSQGLAVAEKLAGTDRVTICTLSDGAAMEGEAKEALAAIPGFARKQKISPFILLISDNNTKLSGRIDQDAYSMKETFSSLESLGWKVIKLENGNNLQDCADTIADALKIARENPSQPVAVWAKTTKGIGTKKTADSSSGGHGFPCKTVSEVPAFLEEVMHSQTMPDLFTKWIDELNQIETKMKAHAVKDTGEKIQKGISKSMIDAAKKGLPVVSVTSDLPGSTGVADFRKEFPLQSFDVGVAESNMISMAAGLSKQGFIPVVDTFAQFGVTKGALPITMGSLSQAPIIAVFSHTGFQDAADGASHQALSYMSMLATIPHVDLYSLSTSEEAENIFNQIIENFVSQRAQGKTPPTSVLFLGRENFPKTFSTEKNKLNYKLTEPQVVHSEIIGGKNVMLLTTGSLVGEALKASQALAQKSIGSIVVNLHTLNRINMDSLKTHLKKCEGRVVTAEDHQVLLGLGAFVSHQLAQINEPVRMKSLGVHGEFGQSAYNAIELYRKHGIDAGAMATAAEGLLK